MAYPPQGGVPPELDDPNAPNRRAQLGAALGSSTPPAIAGTGAPKPPSGYAPPAIDGAGAPKPPAAPTSAPVAPAPSAAATPAPGEAQPPIDPGQAWATLTAQFQAQHGRAMTPQEQQALQSYAGYSGGAVDQAMIDRATQGISSYTGDVNNPFGGAPGGTPATPTAPVDPGLATNDAVQQAIQQLLATGSTPAMSEIDPNNPAMVAQRNAFNRMNERGSTRERLSAAERASARGTLGTGGFDAGQASIEQGAGDRAAGFESQLMSQELQGQRDRVMQAMQMAQASGDSAQSRALSERLATIDNQLRREGMTMQNKLGQGQLGLGLLQALMGDRRAGDALGFNYASLGQQGNAELMRILAGLSS